MSVLEVEASDVAGYRKGNASVHCSDSGNVSCDSEDGNILCSAAVKITGISDGDMRTRSRAPAEITGESGHIQIQGGICIFNSYLQDIGLDTLDYST